MNQQRCTCQRDPRLFSRRATLQAAVGVTAAALFAAGGVVAPAAAQDATPAAASDQEAMPDLTGVAPLPLTGERLATYEAYLAAKLAEFHIPGASIAVVQDGEVAFLQGFGVREMGRAEPVTADTLLRIGSVTKSFSSLLAATLVDAGRMTWETPLVDVLPDFAVADPELTPRLTMADAFCACTGLPRRDWQVIFNAHSLTAESMVAGIEAIPLSAPYGERYQYNNQMVGAGGYAAAVVDGGSPTDLSHAYAIALGSRVLDPIGMMHSTLALSDVVATNDYAIPYGSDITGALQPVTLLEDDSWILPVGPTGGLWSSARDMARYVQTELQRGVSPDGVRVVSAENLERTWQPGVAMPAPAPGASPALANVSQHYGLGWVVGTFGGQQIVAHAGATLGFHSQVTLLPESGLGLVVLTNATVGVAASFTVGAVFRLLEMLFDLPATIDAVLAPGPVALAQAREELLTQLGEVDAVEVAPYLGRYTNPEMGEMTLAVRDGALIFDIGPLRSEMRPYLDADGTIIDYRLIDSPLGSFPSEMMISLQQDTDGRPQPVLTILASVPGDPDERLVYVPVE